MNMRTPIIMPPLFIYDVVKKVQDASHDPRYLTKDEKILANQVLNDIYDYYFLGSRDAYNRLKDGKRNWHELKRDYKGWDSIYINPNGEADIDNIVRIIFKVVEDGIEWNIKIFH